MQCKVHMLCVQDCREAMPCHIGKCCQNDHRFTVRLIWQSFLFIAHQKLHVDMCVGVKARGYLPGIFLNSLPYFLKLRLLILCCSSDLLTCMPVYHICAWHPEFKRGHWVSVLEWELWVIVNCHVDTRNQT